MEEIKPRQYVYKWIMTLFTTTLPLRVVARVWDLYFLDGVFVLFQVTIAILRMLRPKLLAEDMEGILHILQNVSSHIKEDDDDKLVDSIFNIVYPQWVFEGLAELEMSHIAQLDK
jgi:USP6 N-terminal-like protein